MTLDRKNFLSYIIKIDGEVVPAMPDEEEFSVQQIRDHVAGSPEVICETCDGFLLIRNRNASTEGLPVNLLATSVYTKYARRPSAVNGRVFLAHPEHLPPFWRKRMNAGLHSLAATA